jgi:peptide/nickel transport system substrate-binding protein
MSGGKQGAGLLVALAAGLLVSCSLQPQQFAGKSGSPQSPVKKVAAPADIQIIGKVKVDEFNDLATGKETPTTGGQIVVPPNAEPNSLNTYTDNSSATQEISGYIFNSLLRQDPETFQWEGSLAERWTEEDIVVKKDGTKLRGVSSEPRGPGGDVLVKTSSGDVNLPRQEVKEIRKGVSFTFYLRKGVRFHDGQPLTAADVKFSFDTIKDEYVDDPSLRNYYNELESCEVLDDYTVRLTYSKQYWKAREFAGGFDVFPKHIYDADGLLEKDPKAFGQRFNDSPDNRRPIGTGAYQFERWDTGNQIILKRNDSYWDIRRRGHLDRIIFKFISDPVAALQALKNGEVNFLSGITAEEYEKETNNPDFLRRFAKVEYYTGNLSYIGWNMRRPPFNDEKVRLAMAYGALNRQEFLDKVIYGHGVIVTGAEYYFGPGYDHSIQPYPFDPDKARQLLLEAGWYDRDGDGLRDKDGKPFRFELLLPSGSATGRQRAALMKENLRKLGIDMTVRELEWATFLENIYDRKFDACSLGWGMGVEDDPYQLWHTSQKENRGSNHVGFGNAESDRIIEQSRITLDNTARRKLFFDLHRILHETQPYLFLYTTPNLGVYDKRYRGVKFYKVRPGYDLSEWYLPEAAGTASKSEPGRPRG